MELSIGRFFCEGGLPYFFVQSKTLLLYKKFPDKLAFRSPFVSQGKAEVKDDKILLFCFMGAVL